MAKHTDVILKPNQWVELTDADVTNITFLNKGKNSLVLKGMESNNVPTDFDASLVYEPNTGEVNISLSALFPGINAVRLFGFSNQFNIVMVSHA